MQDLENIKNRMLDNFYNYLLENPNVAMVAGITLNVETGDIALKADPTFLELFTITITAKEE